LLPPCVNKGGPPSIIRLTAIPRLEEETPLAASAPAALCAWQARAGAVLTVVDPVDNWYRARLVTDRQGGIAAVPFFRFSRPPESPIPIVLCQALPEKERFELILEKLTELGVCRIVPFTSSRSTTLAARDARQKKSHRWPEVVLRASRQSRRGMIPELAPVHAWEDLPAELDQEGLKILLYEGQAPSLKEVLSGERPERLVLVVGPEGGFAAHEVQQVRQNGVLPVSLGSRVLRTETAAIAAAALAQYELGDLGNLYSSERSLHEPG
jgi:16S rRNA (uracil1498-N3)-methyltransferase